MAGGFSPEALRDGTKQAFQDRNWVEVEGLSRELHRQEQAERTIISLAQGIIQYGGIFCLPFFRVRREKNAVRIANYKRHKPLKIKGL